MLSNKLTFSLASLVVLFAMLLCFPIVAQANVNTALPQPPAFDGDGDGTADDPAAGAIPAGGHVVFGSADTAINAGISGVRYAQLATIAPGDLPGITQDGTDAADIADATAAAIPDLDKFFGFDWVIEIIVPEDSNLDPGDLVISEIMWGLDADPAALEAGTAPTAMQTRQWIEFYNASGEEITLAAGEVLVLFTHPFGNPVATGNYINAADDDADTAGLQVDFVAIRDGDRIDPDDADKKKNRTKDHPHTHVVLDRVSNLDYHETLGFRGRWTLPGGGGRTNLPATANQQSFPQEMLVSANRKINYAVKDMKGGVPSGTDGAQWEATDAFARRNTDSPLIVANPGTGIDPGDYSKVEETADPAADKIVINEIHNGEGTDLDWIEIKNIMEPGSEDSDINIENWEIAKVDGEKTANLVDLPKYILGAQEILLIVSRDPGETILAGGVNVEILGDPTVDQLNKGAQHRYYIEEGMSIPGNPLLLILRDNHEKNEDGKYHENIQDTAGGLETPGYANDRTGATLVFPFKGKASLGGDKAADVGKMGSAWARKPKGVKAGYYIVDNANGRHKGGWESVTGATTMGVGYDREVDLDIAHGTPGYENMIANTVDDYDDTDPDPDGMEIAANLISISEIMYDAGPRWNQVQWIELYNASMTQAVNIKGWELEIRNATDEVESYVDSSFIFDNEVVILPNQTLLIVSGPGASDVPENRVYNLFQHHRRELGLTQRGSVLLSPDGFYLKLTDKANITRDDRTDEDVVVDEAGNVSVKGASREVMWPDSGELGDLFPRDPAVRQSLVRQYGTSKIDGTMDDADDGTMATSWKQSDVTGAGLAYYGHRNDVGTPGYRLGGPLPVSLATFRPVRDKATGEVVITWVTESELNNAGFNILRAESKDSQFKVINLQGIIAGHGTTSEKHVYTYRDKTATKPNVTYYYQIEDVSLNGNRTTLRTTHLRGNVNAAGKATTTWGDLKFQK